LVAWCADHGWHWHLQLLASWLAKVFWLDKLRPQARVESVLSWQKVETPHITALAIHGCTGLDWLPTRWGWIRAESSLGPGTSRTRHDFTIHVPLGFRLNQALEGAGQNPSWRGKRGITDDSAENFDRQARCQNPALRLLFLIAGDRWADSTLASKTCLDLRGGRPKKRGGGIHSPTVLCIQPSRT
jgi:hypothetical protein